MKKNILKGMLAAVLTLALCVPTVSSAATTERQITEYGILTKGTTQVRGYAKYIYANPQKDRITIVIRNGQDIVRTVQTIQPTYANGTVYTHYLDKFSNESLSEFKAEAFF